MFIVFLEFFIDIKIFVRGENFIRIFIGILLLDYFFLIFLILINFGEFF